jgi:alcohol dehydrogenase class IV
MNTDFELNYDFVSPRRVVFGWGKRRDVGILGRTLGKRAFVILGSRQLEARGMFDEVLRWLRQEGIEAVPAGMITREPLVEDVDERVAFLREREPHAGDFVVAVGGGSAIDVAKAAAALATNVQGDSVKDYLEGVGSGLVLEHPPLPVLAMPTTAGTGSEATKNAVISSFDPPFKKSLRADSMMPSIVLIDPELSTSLPREVTARTGMDAITQLIESYVTRVAKPIPRALALQGLALAGEALPEAFHDPSSRNGREQMAHAAFLSGLALANSGLGMAHGVAAALGVHAKVPHGLACAVMLPVAMRTNLEERWSEMADVGTALTRRTWPTRVAAAHAAVEFVEGLLDTLELPRTLSALGVTAEQIPALVHDSHGNSMNGNPRELADDELAELLAGML